MHDAFDNQLDALTADVDDGAMRMRMIEIARREGYLPQ